MALQRNDLTLHLRYEAVLEKMREIDKGQKGCFKCLLALLTLALAIPAINLSLRYFDDMEKLQTALALNVALTLSMPVLISVGIIWQSL